MDPCDASKCLAFDKAICEVDKCGSECKARYFIKLEEVTHMCGEFLLQLL